MMIGEESKAQDRQPDQDSARRPSAWPWLLALLGLTLAGLAAWLAGWPPAISAVDIDQPRANLPLPSPGEQIQLRQSFVAGRNGLAEVELLLALPEDAAGAQGRLTAQLLDAAGSQIAVQTVASRRVTHNQTLRLVFPPQPASQDQRYTIVVSGSAGNRATVWGYDLDVLAGGEVTVIGAASAAQDLRLISRYRLQAGSALARLAEVLPDNLGLGLMFLALAAMPGCLLLLLARPRGWDPAAWLGAALALGAAAWPVLWLLLTAVGGRWRGWSLGLTLAVGWLAVAGLAWRQWRGCRPQYCSEQGWHWAHGLLALVLILGLAGRLLAVRDLAFPPWVDASRHALITALMAEKGQFLRDYLPLLPVERALYHYGFHTLSAGLSLLNGRPLPELLLIVGQWLNGLVPLTVYAGAVLATGRRRAGLVAAALVALPFFFPAYYVTWGRLTQLTAVLILPVALALTWRLVRGGRAWRRLWWLLGLLAGGLFLIHFRVFLLYLPFAALVALISLGRHLRWLTQAAVMALLLISPQVLNLITAMTAGPRPSAEPIPGYNAFPVGYLRPGWEIPFLILGGVAVVISVGAILTRRWWGWLAVALAAWPAVIAVLLFDRLGLPLRAVLNLNAAYITLFVPLSLLLGLEAERLWFWLGRWPALRLAAHAPLGAGLAALILFGLYQQATILNPQTILARPADLAGLDRLAELTGGEARVAANSWRWLGDAWAGHDGGAWILPLVGAATTIPPVDYIHDSELSASVLAFNEAAESQSDWSAPAAAEWLTSQGISHIFVGQRGGFFDPSTLARNPGLALLYSDNGVFIFEVLGGDPAAPSGS